MKKIVSILLAMVIGLFMVGTLYAECPGVDAARLVEVMKGCVQDARIRDPGYLAYFNPMTCKINSSGSSDWNTFWNADNVFWQCLIQNGFKKN